MVYYSMVRLEVVILSATIAGIEKGSLAEVAGLKVGDTILKINNIEINDYLDYMYASCNEEITIELKGGKVHITNYDFEPLGISFDTLLIDEPKSCRNKCVFCFIDQFPKCMRETCYFKDDDYRLSFLQGNYVTMTNMTNADVDRIIEYNIPRINISVHTTNPSLRCKMLSNKNAGTVLEYLGRFADGGLNINAQIVLCPEYNDKAELDRTISDIAKLGDAVESVSIVPVGLSAHRDDLTALKGFDKTSSALTIAQVEKWQKKFKEERGINLVYLADEFYLNAEVPFPDYSEYDGFPQIENGVGLCASLIYEFNDALALSPTITPKHRKTIATGFSAYPVIKSLTEKLSGNMIDIIPIANDFFGHSITVTGLLTGGDIINQLRGKVLGESLLLSSSMLRHNEDVLLDNISVSDIERELKAKVKIVSNDGYELLDALLA